MNWILLIALGSKTFIFDQHFESKKECLAFRDALIRYTNVQFDYSVCREKTNDQSK